MLAVTIPLAFALRSYWALVAGMVAGNVAAVLVSYLFPSLPPKVLPGSWGVVGFSKWLQVNSILQYVRDKGAVLVLGRLLDASAVGVFSLAREIASIPSSTLVAPLNRAGFPATRGCRTMPDNCGTATSPSSD
jgi:lipopolysaccharide exporter